MEPQVDAPMGDLNLKMMKCATLGLLHTDPVPAEFATFVHHPFFQNDMAYDAKAGEFFNLFDDLERAIAPYEELIDSARGIADLLCLVRDPYHMLWFALCAPFIEDPEEYADTLKHCWATEEWPSRDVNVPVDEMVKLFSKADPIYMTENLPCVDKVYRGVNRGGSPYGLSWTTDLETAKWFAGRFGDDGAVYEMELDPQSVLAYIDERGEAEVVVNTRGLEGKIRLLERS